MPAPIGRVNQGTNLPADLTRALYSLQQSWPRYTPSRLNTEAFLQLALGDVAAAQATLDTAAQKMISASIPWYATLQLRESYVLTIVILAIHFVENPRSQIICITYLS